MPSYEFSGLNKQQKMQRGVVNAESIQEAKAKVKKLGLVHISVQRRQSHSKSRERCFAGKNRYRNQSSVEAKAGFYIDS